MSEYNIHLGDCVAWAKEYRGEKFHALFCDAPYHLTSIVSRYGKEDSAPAKGGVYNRSAKGFMGKTWDGGDIAFQVDTWKAFKRIMYPGAFGMSFASSRGWHKLAIAIEGIISLYPGQLIEQADLLKMARKKKDWKIVEAVENWLRETSGLTKAIQDAGFIIHPSIFGWVYGSGFPKATRIDTQIDNQLGVERKSKGKRLGARNGNNKNNDYGSFASANDGTFEEFEATSELAKQWQGYRYGLQALKPALEPIILFQKPYQGRAIDNITKTGAGALNIEGGRIGTSKNVPASPRNNQKGNGYTVTMPNDDMDTSGWNENIGRWPANFFIDTETGQILDRQALKYTGDKASDFFFQVSFDLDEADPIFYCVKANEDERNAGLDSYLTIKYNIENLIQESILWKEENTGLVVLLKKVISEVGQIESLSIEESGENIMVLCHKDSLSITKTITSKITELKILNWLTLLPINDYIAIANYEKGNGGKNVQSARNGKRLQKKTGTSQNRDGYLITDVVHAIYKLLSKISKEEGWKILRSEHPTHKPIDLCEYLCTLLLPPDKYSPRRLFIPFSGVASEMIGAIRAGWDFVQGVEITKEYIPIAEARIKYWSSKPKNMKMFTPQEIKKTEQPRPRNLNMFEE